MADIGYYQPYESESENSDSDESEYWSSSEEEEALITSPVSLLRTAGPAFANQKDALLDSRTNQYSSINVAFSAPEKMDNIHNGISLGATNFKTEARAFDSIINVASQDRDYAVYSNATEFTLHLPRVYKNVTNFDIQQIKFLNAFYYFRNEKNNTFFDYIEQGRLTPSLSNYPPTFDSNTPYKLRVNIREGSYNINQLLQELQYQLNTSPLFFYFPNGFVDFAPLFAGSGNLGIGFNEAGSYYYDSLNNVFVANPTKDYIIKQYFNSQNAGLTFYTYENILNAYYYPVLREVFLNPVALLQLNVTNPLIQTYLLPGESIETRIIYDFQGLNDMVPLLIIQDNQNFLDIYRTQNTFIGSPVNQYSFRVDTFNQRLTIYSSGLNTSIVNTFTGELASNYKLAYLSCNLDSNGVQYNNLVLSNQKILSTFSQMKDYLYETMANYFGIPFNSYTIEQLTNYSNLYNLRDGNNSCNIPLNYSPNSNVPFVPDYNETDPSPIQYDRYSNISTCNYNIVTEADANSNIVKKNYQIDVDASDVVPNPNAVILTNEFFCNADGTLNINPKKRTLDIVANIDPYSYTVFTFKSTIRQTIQIETIPVPHKFRYFNYTKTYGTTAGNYFNYELDFCNNSVYLSNIESDFSNQSTMMISSNIDTSTTGDIGQTSNDGYNNASTYPLNITQRVLFYKFTTPSSSAITTNIHNFYMNLTLDLTATYPGSNVPITTFLYGDKSAFLNDMFCYYTTTTTSNNIFSNLTSDYLLSNTFTNNSNLTFSNEYQNNKDYYLIVAGPLTTFSSLNFKIFAWFGDLTCRVVSIDSSGNPLVDPPLEFYQQPPESNADMYKVGRGTYANQDYYKVYDRVYNKLPINSNLYENTNPENNSFNDPIIPDGPAIGYDVSNVSTDLTDYKGFINPMTSNIYSNYYSNESNVYKATARVDPTNNYVFNALTPYNSNTQTYIGSNSCNQIIDGSTGPTKGQIYTPGVVSNRQYKIVHWHDTTYFPPQALDFIEYGAQYKAPANTNFTLQIAPYGGNEKNNLTNAAAQGYSTDGVLTSNYNNTVYSSNGYQLWNRLNSISGISFLPTDGSWDIDTFMFKSAYTDFNTDPNLQIAYIGVYDLQNVIFYNINSIDSNKALYLLERSGVTYYTSSLCNEYAQSNFGFDLKFGSYHQFKIMDSFSNSSSNGRISGYTQSYLKTLNDHRNFYTLVPFNSAGQVINYYMLCGSPVPHPDITNGVWTTTTVDGQTWPDITTSNLPYKNLFALITPDVSSNPTIPTYVPKTVFDTLGSNALYASQYEQSLPIVTQPLQVKEVCLYFNDIDGNYDYNPSIQPGVGLSNYRLSHAAFPDPTNPTLPLVTFTSNNISRSYRIFQSGTTGPRSLQPYLGEINYNATTDSPPGPLILPAYSTYDRSNVITWTENNNVLPNLSSVGSRYVLLYYYNSATPSAPGSYVYWTITNPLASPILGMQFGSNTNAPKYTSNIFLANSESPGPDKRLINISYDSTNAVAFKSDGGRIYLTELPGATGPTGLSAFKAVAMSSDPLITQNARFNEINGEWIPGAWDPTNYICFLFNSASGSYIYKILSSTLDNTTKTFQAYRFNNLLAGKIMDIKIDSYGYIHYINSDDPYHLHKLEEGLLIGNQSIVSTIDPSLTYNIDTFNAIDTTSAFTFDRSILSNFSFTFGKANAIFYQWYDYTPSEPWIIEGSAMNSNDFHLSLSPRYNILYPTMKIGLTKKTNDYNSITDTQALLVSPSANSNVAPEFGRTYSFFYSNASKFSNDIYVNGAGATGPYKWGYESSNNYSYSDTTFDGYVFNSYIYNIQLKNNTCNYYLALRGSRPTEKYQTILRIKAPNRLDYGFITMSNLFLEVSNVYTSLVSNYNPAYATTLSNFDQQFIMSNRYFGGGAIPGFLGFPITTSNTNGPYFSNFISQISNYYATYLLNQAIISAIDSNANSNFSNYLNTYWSNILPTYAIQRQNVTDPIPFSLLFLSSIPDGRFKSLDEGWGIGWNLGFPKADTPYDTVQVANSFYKIFEDYIFLRLNPEQGMNRVDYTSREHLDRSLVTQGTIQTYYGKLLLNNFGSYGTTFIGNPIDFNPPISQLDKLQIQWLDSTGNVLSNADCEWNAALHITENRPTATLSSLIPTLIQAKPNTNSTIKP